MGYRVKQQCFNDLEHAKAVYFSQIAPAINANGQLMQIEHIGQEYILNGQVLQAAFLSCDPKEDFAMGGAIGLAFLFLLATYWGINQAKKQLR